MRVARTRAFDQWLEDITDSRSPAYLGDAGQHVQGQVEALIDILRAAEHPVGRPDGAPLRGSRYALHELRWPRMGRGEGPDARSGQPVVRVFYGLVVRRFERSQSRSCSAVVLLGGNKTSAIVRSGSQDRWYADHIRAAEVRLEQWCADHPTLAPVRSSR